MSLVDRWANVGVRRMLCAPKGCRRSACQKVICCKPWPSWTYCTANKQITAIDHWSQNYWWQHEISQLLLHFLHLHNPWFITIIFAWHIIYPTPLTTQIPITHETQNRKICKISKKLQRKTTLCKWHAKLPPVQGWASLGPGSPGIVVQNIKENPSPKSIRTLQIV